MRISSRRGAIGHVGALALAAAFSVWSCAAPKPRPGVGPSPSAVAPSNFELSAYEVVVTPEDDTLEYVAVFVDGQLKGRTEVAAKSRPKLWRGMLPEGNHPMRFEVWDSTDGVSGVQRPDDLQPRERFIRIVPGQKTGVVLKLYDRGRRHLFSFTREPE